MGSRGRTGVRLLVRGLVFREFGGEISLESLPDPACSPDGVVVQVLATGVCRSDWHGWRGHDPDVTLPHVPGHELAGTIVDTGRDVTRWKRGDRVTVPFVCGCGTCPQCTSGNQQVCDYQSQPGFTHWGSFAEYVRLDFADENLVTIPPGIDDTIAATLGCRFVTAFRAVVDQARVAPGEWVAVFGCGGVGLSAVMIARAAGARVIAVDISDARLALARDVGAVSTVRAGGTAAELIRELSGGGAHVSIDAVGGNRVVGDAIASLGTRGRHVQVGLTLAAESRPSIPMDRVVAKELTIMGSHGIQAHRYPAVFALLDSGALDPELLVGKRIPLAQAPAELAAMETFEQVGMTVVDRF